MVHALCPRAAPGNEMRDPLATTHNDLNATTK
jgi:hypothetical protein